MFRHNSHRPRPTLANRHNALVQVARLQARNLMAFTPKQLVQAYGFNQLSQTGSGQTIALIDAYYDPTIQSDIATFSCTYGLAPLDGKNGDGTFTQPDLTSNKVQSPAGDDWTLETDLDVHSRSNVRDFPQPPACSEGTSVVRFP